jgi:hypothetical protein
VVRAEEAADGQASYNLHQLALHQLALNQFAHTTGEHCHESVHGAFQFSWPAQRNLDALENLTASVIDVSALVLRRVVWSVVSCERWVYTLVQVAVIIVFNEKRHDLTHPVRGGCNTYRAPQLEV